MKTLIKNATIVNEGLTFKGSVWIDGEQIIKVARHDESHSDTPEADRIIDAEGLYLIPGVIDDHVHFRDPGLTHKADITSESRAAAAGGVTSYSRSERKIRWPMYCSKSFAWIVKSVDSISDWLIVASRIATFR